MRRSSSAPISGGDDIVSLLGLMTDRVEEAVSVAVAQAQRDHLESLRDTAASDPRWSPLGPALRAWEDEDGHYTWGVPDDAPEATQAISAEFGDERHAPVPLVRRGLTSHTDSIRWTVEDYLREEGF